MGVTKRRNARYANFSLVIPILGVFSISDLYQLNSVMSRESPLKVYLKRRERGQHCRLLFVQARDFGVTAQHLANDRPSHEKSLLVVALCCEIYLLSWVRMMFNVYRTLFALSIESPPSPVALQSFMLLIFQSQLINFILNSQRTCLYSQYVLN